MNGGIIFINLSADLTYLLPAYTINPIIIKPHSIAIHTMENTTGSISVKLVTMGMEKEKIKPCFKSRIFSKPELEGRRLVFSLRLIVTTSAMDVSLKVLLVCVLLGLLPIVLALLLELSMWYVPVEG